MSQPKQTPPKPKAPPPETTSQIRRARNGFSGATIFKDHSPIIRDKSSTGRKV